MIKKTILNKILACLLVFVMILGCCWDVNLAKGKTIDQVATTPSDNWTQDDWDDYYEDIVGELTTTQCARYMTLDGEPMTDYKLYYVVAPHSRSSYDTFATEAYVEIPQLTNYPGVYVFDTTMNETGTNTFPYGYFLLYDKDETDTLNEITTVYTYEMLFTAGVAIEQEWYTVSFEQGDIDTFELPETEIYLKGHSFNNPYEVDNGICYPSYEGIIAGGYAFKNWQDRENNVLTSTTKINKPLIVHPTYVNEQENTYSNYDIASSNQYYDWTYDLEDSEREMDKKTITTGVEFLKEMCMNPGSEAEGQFVIIDSDITIDNSTVESFKNETQTDVNSYSGIPRLYQYNDFLIITGNGSLTLNGVDIQGYMDENFHITVQSGGELSIKNSTSLSDTVLSVQKDAEVNIEKSHVNLNQLFNHGTVNMVYPGDGTHADAGDYSSGTIDIDGVLFNSKTGKINIPYGNLGLDNEQRWIYYDEPLFTTIGDMKYVPYRNRGTISISRDGRMELSASSSSYQNDRMELIPFWNEGTLSLSAIPGGDDYSDAVLSLEYSRFLNDGTLTINQPTYTANRSKNTYVSRMEYEPAVFKAYSSEFTNSGTMNINVSKGIGFKSVEKYFDPEDTIEDTSATEIQYGKFANLADGTVNVSSTKDSVGLYIGQFAYLTNQGSMTLNAIDNERINNVTLLTMGKLINQGSMVNNGVIGYSSNAYGYTDAWRIGYTGNAYTGSGDERVMYRIYCTKLDNTFLETGKQATITIDGITVSNISDYYDAHGFFPLNKTLSYTAKVTGYKDFAGSFTTAATVADYVYNTDSDNNPNAKTGFSFHLTKATEQTNDDESGNKKTEDTTQKTTTPIAKKGAKVVDTKTKSTFTVTKTGESGGTVTYTKINNKKATKVTVPQKVTINGRSYKVTSIAANAFKNCKKLKSITISNQVKSIGKNAFAGCKALKKITIKSTLLTKKSVGAKAFKGINAKAVIKVPAKKLKAYKALLKTKGIGKKVKVKK